jgi:hypothetical protein
MRRTTTRKSARQGKKSLACPLCPVGGKGNVVMRFRGTSQARLDRHKREVHGPEHARIVAERRARRGD